MIKNMARSLFFLKHLYYFFILSRPLNVLITAISIFIAALITGKLKFNILLLYAEITAVFITSGANIINDIYDIKIDRINKPERILPSEKITVTQAWIYFCIAYSIAILFAILSGVTMLLIALTIALLLFLYSTFFKKTVLLGNLIVSFSAATAFLYGAEAVSHWTDGIIPAVFAFFFHFGREIVKDMQDLKGDLEDHAVTFAGRFGIKKSVFLINVIFFILIILTIIPYLLDIYNRNYLWIVIFGVDLVLIFVCLILWRYNDVSSLGKISHLLKLDMLVGLLAIYAGVEHVTFPG